MPETVNSPDHYTAGGIETTDYLRAKLTEARELRATLEEALNPLYAARTGTIPALAGVQAAIAVLHRVDKALLTTINRQEIPGLALVVDESVPVDEAWFVTLVNGRPRVVGKVVDIGDDAKE